MANNSDSQDKQDYQDYQDYHDYLSYQASAKPKQDLSAKALSDPTNVPGGYNDTNFSGINKGLERVDAYTGAPARAGISAAQQGNNPISAAYNQAGKPANTAPTGEDIVGAAGVTNPYAKKALGFGMDMAANPLNLLDPAISGAKYLGDTAKAISSTSKYAETANSAEAAVNYAKSQGLGNKPGLYAKIGEARTGIPEQQIQTYINNKPEIDANIKKYGGDMIGATDELKGNIQSDIRGVKNQLSGQIRDSLGSENTPYVDMNPVLNSLKDAKSKINSTLRPDEANEIADITSKISAVSPDGIAHPQSAHDVKELLQEIGKSSYQKNGKIFAGGEKYQQAAKDAARVARQQIESVAPEVGQANSQLSDLHNIEDVMGSNLLKEGGSADAIIKAGATDISNPNTKALQRLGEITGKDYVGEAQKIAAQKAFTNTSLLPTDVTGKSVGRMLVGGAVGSAAGGPLGTLAGYALTSPATLKAEISAGRVSADFVKSLIGKADNFNASDLRKLRLAIPATSGSNAISINRAAQKNEPNRGLADALGSK